ncbi:MAG: SRPBCC family protein [Woeseiaceae bacterium]|nr:SRPBCC family protein [Woeseiaceae bacterium]
MTLSVSAEQVIDAPAHRVWEAISEPGNLETCHPFCASNPVDVWPGPGSRDTIHYLSGWSYERHFEEWIEGVGYDLEIGRPGGSRSSVSWRITPINDGSSTLRIVVHPSAVRKFPPIVRQAVFYLRLRPLLRSYLDSVVRGFEWYVTKGEPVPRNAFGKHPWFSGNE